MVDGMKKRVLIIEDELNHLRAMKEKLESAGFEVITAEDGDEGLVQAKTGNPDIILLDIILPHKDGFQVLEDLRAAESHIPVVVVSNSGQPVEIDRARELGAVDYLVKAEFNPSDVVEKVKEVLPASAVNTASPVARVVDDKDTRVLIVDDDRFLREMLKKKLEGNNFLVEEAITVESALACLSANPPQLVVLDLVLPGTGGGFEILRRMREDKRLSSTPVVIMTNINQQEDMERAKLFGVKEYLLKTRYTPDEIVARIKEILNESYVN